MSEAALSRHGEQEPIHPRLPRHPGRQQPTDDLAATAAGSRHVERGQAAGHQLLHMIRAAHRCSQGFSEYGLPPELRHLEPEMPAFAAQCLQTILTAGEGDHN